MKTVPIMEAQHNLARILRRVELGEELAITRRKKIVARLCPVPAVTELVFPDFKARARATWKTGWTGSSSDDLLTETRGER